jgi:hypothetical protein
MIACCLFVDRSGNLGLEVDGWFFFVEVLVVV